MQAFPRGAVVAYATIELFFVSSISKTSANQSACKERQKLTKANAGIVTLGMALKRATQLQLRTHKEWR